MARAARGGFVVAASNAYSFSGRQKQHSGNAFGTRSPTKQEAQGACAQAQLAGQCASLSRLPGLLPTCMIDLLQIFGDQLQQARRHEATHPSHVFV